jgi:DNA-binding GntR family transcriptional regulator
MTHAYQTTHEPCTVTLFRTAAEDALLYRIRGEYRDMPGMRLTLEQAMRLFMLDRGPCTRVLDSLETKGFLKRDPNGRYMRAHAGY